MYSFCNDYSEGAIPMIMERLQEFNKKQNPGYGMDEICDKAREKFKKYCNVLRVTSIFSWRILHKQI